MTLMSADGGISDTHDSDETQPLPDLPEQGSTELVRSAPDGRIIVYLAGNKMLAPSFQIRAAAMDSFQAYVDVQGVKWSSVPQTVKHIYFDEFRQRFTWDSTTLRDDVVRTKWANIAGIAYKQFVHDVKKNVMKGKPVRYMRDETLEIWKDYWDRPDVKAKSAQARSNRLSEPAGPGTGIVVHHGGSRSAMLHAHDMAKSKGIPLAAAKFDTFKRLRAKKGEFTDGRSQHIAEEVERRLAELREPLPGTTEDRVVLPEEVDRIFSEVVHVDKKGRMLGLGCMSQMFATSDGSIASTTTSHHALSPAAVAEITDLKIQLEERKRNEVELKAEMATMREQMQTLVAYMASSGFRPLDTRNDQ